MKFVHSVAITLLAAAVFAVPAPGQITTVADLVNAVNNGLPGDTVTIGPGTFELAAPLTPRPGMTILGAGQGQTVITAAPAWQPGTASLPDNGVNQNTVQQDAYLFNLGDNTTDLTISNLTLTAPNLHGAIYGNNPDGLEVSHTELNDFLWSSIRVFRMNDGRIHNNTFIDAGGRSAVTSGQTGGAIYATFTNDSVIHDNRFTKTPDHPGNFFGIKGRKATNTRIHHNTIDVNFSIEFPFENDAGVEIDHNWLDGVVSIPKFAGGPPGAAGDAFHLHHNYFQTSYAIEGARNGLEVNNNLFDFDTADDGGNLISQFGNNNSPIAPGDLAFHNNLVKNPGRGVFWSAPPQRQPLLLQQPHHRQRNRYPPHRGPLRLQGRPQQRRRGHRLQHRRHPRQHHRGDRAATPVGPERAQHGGGHREQHPHRRQRHRRLRQPRHRRPPRPRRAAPLPRRRRR